ncbi:MAG TPA: hypothetical protein VEV82_04125, partial [Actinomycetota bacterium]|nr:hypothetical protein [Actinomycetota bacterium]
MSQTTEGGSSRNKLLTLMIVVFLIGAPAAALRAFCIGHSCDEEESVTSEIPFCSLPSSVREPISAGFEGELHRSPDILGVTQDDVFVRGGTAFPEGEPAPQWPSLAPISRRVPLAFSGTGVDPAATVPDETRLDAVAPTLSEVIDFRRPNPQVRSGQAIEGLASGDHPSLVVEVVMKNTGSGDLEAAPDDWPNLRALVESGPGTLDADAGSLPLDPAAIMTTVGTGGLPHQHGIVGTFVRTNEGRVVRAWGPHTPVHIIATLPDDLDERLDQEPLVGLIRTDVSDTGLIGGNWYVDVDKDTIATNDRDPARSVTKMLDSGWGDDDVPDVLAVALEGDISAMDKDLGRIEDALAAADSWALAVTATGTNAAS